MYPDQIFRSLPPTSPVSHSSIFSQVHTLFFKPTQPTKPGRMNVALVSSTVRSSLCDGHTMTNADTALPKPTTAKASHSGL